MHNATFRSSKFRIWTFWTCSSTAYLICYRSLWPVESILQYPFSASKLAKYLRKSILLYMHSNVEYSLFIILSHTLKGGTTTHYSKTYIFLKKTLRHTLKGVIPEIPSNATPSKIPANQSPQLFINNSNLHLFAFKWILILIWHSKKRVRMVSLLFSDFRKAQDMRLN